MDPLAQAMSAETRAQLEPAGRGSLCWSGAAPVALGSPGGRGGLLAAKAAPSPEKGKTQGLASASLAGSPALRLRTGIFPKRGTFAWLAAGGWRGGEILPGQLGSGADL